MYINGVGEERKYPNIYNGVWRFMCAIYPKGIATKKPFIPSLDSSPQKLLQRLSKDNCSWNEGWIFNNDDGSVEKSANKSYNVFHIDEKLDWIRVEQVHEYSASYSYECFKFHIALNDEDCGHNGIKKDKNLETGINIIHYHLANGKYSQYKFINPLMNLGDKIEIINKLGALVCNGSGYLVQSRKQVCVYVGLDLSIRRVGGKKKVAQIEAEFDEMLMCLIDNKVQPKPELTFEQDRKIPGSKFVSYRNDYGDYADKRGAGQPYKPINVDDPFILHNFTLSDKLYQDLRDKIENDVNISSDNLQQIIDQHIKDDGIGTFNIERVCEHLKRQINLAWIKKEDSAQILSNLIKKEVIQSLTRDDIIAQAIGYSSESVRYNQKVSAYLSDPTHIAKPLDYDEYMQAASSFGDQFLKSPDETARLYREALASKQNSWGMRAISIIESNNISENTINYLVDAMELLKKEENTYMAKTILDVVFWLKQEYNKNSVIDDKKKKMFAEGFLIVMQAANDRTTKKGPPTSLAVMFFNNWCDEARTGKPAFELPLEPPYRLILKRE